MEGDDDPCRHRRHHHSSVDGCIMFVRAKFSQRLQTPAMPGKIVEKPEQRKMVRISKEALFWSSHVLFF